MTPASCYRQPRSQLRSGANAWASGAVEEPTKAIDSASTCLRPLSFPSALVSGGNYFCVHIVHPKQSACSFKMALRREMTRLGAQEMPKWEGRWPGLIDLLIKLYGHRMNGYPGDGIDDATDVLRLTFKTKFIGFDQVWTSDPRHVKSILAMGMPQTNAWLMP